MRERHDVHVADADPRLPQAELDGLVGKGLRVLLAVEPLLLHERHGLAVLHQRRGGVV